MGPDGLAAGATSAIDTERLDDSVEARLLAQRLTLLCEQWARVPIAVAAAVAAVGYIAWGSADRAVIVGWGVLSIAGILVRGAYCRRLLGRGIVPGQAERIATRLTVIAVLNGVVSGSGAFLILPALDVERLAVATLIFLGWGTGGISVNGAYPRSYAAFSAPFFASVAGGWFAAGAPFAAVVAVLLLLYLLVLNGFARDTGRMVGESIRLRYANEELLEQKDRLLGLMRTAFEKAEAARLVAEEASRSKSQFLASASHDLRQPLHALSLLTALLNDISADAKVREVGHHIDRSVQSLDGLFGALLDLSKLDAGVIAPESREIALDDLLERLSVEFRAKAQEKGLVYQTDVEPVWVRTDPILLERILRNLLENAIRYTPAGRVSLHGHRSGRDAVVSVTDTGIGIPRNEQGRVFDEFYQLQNPGRDRTKGLGLGLSIVKRLAGLLGYRVELSSGAGQGSVFAVTLPDVVVAAPQAAAPGPRGAGEAADATLGGLAVLIVEDDAEVRGAMSMALHAWGCRPLVAGSLAEARILLATTGLVPSVILSDLRLANGASGIDAIRALRAEIGPAPAALVTGDTAAEKLAEVRAAGFPVLHKPVQAAELRRMLRELSNAAGKP
ncbi:MAG: hybrid sensor histidine kinase/response regulator [Burkholderiales bacterium]|jgi:signal transduction histidine kinase/CheY-like chemotaxis protein|nr:hybrid sensor histidine kinase/response regulator [Burkholderiales bacterium]